MNFEKMSKQRKMMLIAAAVGVISMFLPWVSVLGFSVNGLHGWGVLVFLCFVAAGVLALVGDQSTNLPPTNWMLSLIAGGIAALIMLVNLANGAGVLGSLGIGFYGALLASVGVVAFAFIHRSATDNLQSGFDSLRSSVSDKVTSVQTKDGTNTTVTTVSHKPTEENTSKLEGTDER